MQVAIKLDSPFDGLWSRWSDPARAVVPQSAGASENYRENKMVPIEQHLVAQ